jgi:hypothetical protein
MLKELAKSYDVGLAPISRLASLETGRCERITFEEIARYCGVSLAPKLCCHRRRET